MVVEDYTGDGTLALPGAMLRASFWGLEIQYQQSTAIVSVHICVCVCVRERRRKKKPRGVSCLSHCFNAEWHLSNGGLTDSSIHHISSLLSIFCTACPPSYTQLVASDRRTNPHRIPSTRQAPTRSHTRAPQSVCQWWQMKWKILSLALFEAQWVTAITDV